MESGKEGWIPNQYLTQQRIAADLLKETRQRLEVINQEYELALLRIKELENRLTKKNLNEKVLTTRNLDISKELESVTRLSAKAIEINEENSQLLTKQKSLIANVDSLKSAYRVLQDDSTQLWFLCGAGSVLISIVFGSWVARTIYRDSKSGGWA